MIKEVLYTLTFIWVVTVAAIISSCDSVYHLNKAKDHYAKAVKKNPELLLDIVPDSTIIRDTIVKYLDNGDSIVTIVERIEIKHDCPEIDVTKVKSRRDKRRDYKIEKELLDLRKRIHDDSVKIAVLRIKNERLEIRGDSKENKILAKAEKKEAKKCNWLGIYLLGWASAIIAYLSIKLYFNGKKPFSWIKNR